jgi:hypothetical protein
MPPNSSPTMAIQTARRKSVVILSPSRVRNGAGSTGGSRTGERGRYSRKAGIAVQIAVRARARGIYIPLASIICLRGRRRCASARKCRRQPITAGEYGGHVRNARTGSPSFRWTFSHLAALQDRLHEMPADCIRLEPRGPDPALASAVAQDRAEARWGSAQDRATQG